jgi:hypothetical protein
MNRMSNDANSIVGARAQSASVNIDPAARGWASRASCALPTCRA